MHLGEGGATLQFRQEHSIRPSSLWYRRSPSFIALLVIGIAGICHGAENYPPPTTQTLSKLDVDLLDDISRRAFRYFWEQASPRTGLILDRTPTTGEPEDGAGHAQVASIAATGFGLTAVCIARDHRWIGREAARERVLTTLRFLAHEAPQVHGWFYHYLDSNSGERAWRSEVSSIDTALLLAGVLTVRQCLEDDPEIVNLANTIYARIDFPWMMDGSNTHFSHGWTPEQQFLPYRWDTYSEMLILYALGIGSPTHPIPADTWGKWNLPVVTAGAITYVGRGPLFIHQYSQAWLDLRDRVSRAPSSTDSPASSASDSSARSNPADGVDYYANSVAATRAQREYFMNFSSAPHRYSANVWGLTASDSTQGYTDWGAGSEHPRIDGTVVPSAAAGSLMFTPDICIPALRTMLLKYGRTTYGRYGFADAFNPDSGWVSSYVIGIDVGITLLSAENLRTGRVWEWFMANTAPERALTLVGMHRPNYPSKTIR